jgi:hypothetical protein
MPILIILMLFTIGYVFQASGLPMGTLENIGPGLYPVIISVTMLILLLVQFVREVKTPSTPTLTVTKYQLAFAVLLGLFIFFLDRIGYMFVALLFCFSFSVVLGWQLRDTHKDESKLKTMLIWPLVAAVLITGADYILFELAFDFHLP